jgi:hypothetical protein
MSVVATCRYGFLLAGIGDIVRQNKVRLVRDIPVLLEEQSA